MEEERPLQEAREALRQEAVEPTTIARAGSDEPSPGALISSSRQSGLIIIAVLLVAALIIAGLFLPPISLGERLGLGGDEATDTGPEQAGPAELVVAGEIALTLDGQPTGVGISRLSRSDFAAGQVGDEWEAALDALPGHLTLSSNVYAVDFEGPSPVGSAEIAIPAGAQPYQTVDLYGWDGASWTFMPSAVSEDGGKLLSGGGALPHALALVQTTRPSDPEITAELLPTQELPGAVVPMLTEVLAGTLTLGPGGSLLGEAVPAPAGSYRQLMRVTNTGAIVDTVSLTELLSNPDLHEQHIAEVVGMAAGYAGVNLDYQGAAENQRGAFTGFVQSLAESLHAAGLSLAVTLESPVSSNGGWETAGQDWAAIGQAADVVYLAMPLNPTLYGDNDLAEGMIFWATRQVERSKLAIALGVDAVDGVGESHLPVASARALANFGELTFIQGSAEVDPATSVEVALSGSASALEWDPAGLTYRYTYEQAGQAHNVWLASAALLSHQSRFAARYNLRGIAVRGLAGVAEGEGYAAAIGSFLGTADAPQPSSAAIVWAVEDPSGGVVASSTGEQLAFAWEGANEPGKYKIRADFAHGDSVASLGTLEVSVLAPPEPTPTPEPTEEPIVQATATPEPVADTPDVNPGDADAAANVASNVRSGPGISYPIIGGLQRGETVALIGRNGDASWLQVRMAGEEEGWVYAQLLTVNAAVDVGALAVIEVDPPPVAGGGDGSPAPPPPSIPPAGGGSFELGGQTHTLANPTLMNLAGMNWVKFQHKWGPGDSPSAVAGRIQQAHANGFKVLLSIPGANTYPSSIDFGAYVEFLRGVAALGPNAIEIWNEMNIDFEWPAGQINPSSYVNNMLAPAYNAIKSANPNVMVISGAPAPTGFDNGTNAWADDRYMAGMAAAGGASYMDCVGVHHNAGATSPNATSGHPAGSGHYSWYFWPTLNLYYNAFGGSRPVCFTELGYLSGEDFGGVPGRFAWAAGTTVAQHAQWLAEAASLSANSGRVRMLIVFNVDFTHYGDDPQAGYAMLRPNGSCPSCDLLRQVMGG